MSAIKILQLSGFDDPVFGAAEWNQVLPKGPTDVVFLTHAWQHAWWESFGRGSLLMFAAMLDGQVTTIAPFFADSGMAYLVASGGSDYLDFIGDTGDPAVLDALLGAVRASTPDFIGFKLYHVPDDSPTATRVGEACERLGLLMFDEGDLAAPALDLIPGAAVSAASRASLVRHDRKLATLGRVTVDHLMAADAVLELLPRFFEQHIARRQVTQHPSQFLDQRERRFFERLAFNGATAGWLRFTAVRCDDTIVACHFGMMHSGRFLWYKPTFDPAMSKYSPGEVLLRRLFLEAEREGAGVFDFGLGDEAFKLRFANRIKRVRTWGLYRQDISGGEPRGDQSA